ncbi:gluconate 2-dehydrogenase subunit 3 family protein [Novosphingobium profundi]|uniref:gluconate 2-dehydrogenase subunit 3 family protein n=1 Tax=Novosphingobium profundi TaxID=1774954 RepID=UPI001BDAA8DD|nr:gluconate 2-dehydrogenase subunit 3 family protein [Novosphingobium profundi]MBT0670730.1 gluconate 2-dehydrogenase subunit 3 family protein [Novosphingobium profundi]
MHRRDILQWIAAAAFAGPAMAQDMTGMAGHAMASRDSVPPPPPHTPFAPARHAALERLVQLVIPADDTPGAREAGVPAFIEMMHQHWMNEEERRRCDAELDLVMAAFASGAAIPAALYEGARFKAPTLRKLTIYGYYTSEVGASEELTLNLVPGAYDACAQVGAQDRAPSLNSWGIALSLANPGAL